MVAYAIAHEIAYTAAYIKLHMIFSEFLRKWETTFLRKWEATTTTTTKNLFLEGCASLTQP